MGDQDRYSYIHLKEISVDFIKTSPTSVLELVFKDDTGLKHKSHKFKEGDLVHWNLDTYIRTDTRATLTIQRALFKISVAQIEFEFKPKEFRDHSIVGLKDRNHLVTVNVKCGRSKSFGDDAGVLSSQARTNLASKVFRFLKHPQLAALPPPTSWRGYNLQCPAVHWLNDDVLLSIFDCYRLDNHYHWNLRLGWCKLSHVCQRWRHLLYGYAYYLGIHIECTHGTPTIDTLDHIPPLPLFVNYGYKPYCGHTIITEQDELGIYHALRFHDRVRHVRLVLPSSTLHKVLVLIDEHFPILEHLLLLSPAGNNISFALPKAFLAPNLRHLTLPGITPPRRLRFLTSTVFLVKLELSNIDTSSYFRPRLLVARLRSLPQLKELSIIFSTPIPCPSTERELLGEQGAPVTLTSLNSLQFKGVSAYLEHLVAQIRAPFLDQLDITLFNQIAFALPHLSHIIHTGEGFKHPVAMVLFGYMGVSVVTARNMREFLYRSPCLLRVECKLLDWKVDYAAQICNAIIPSLPDVEQLALHSYAVATPSEWQNGAVDAATWHGFLRSFIGLKALRVDDGVVEELSRVLQVDGVGSDPGFLPNLRHIIASRNPFTSFIHTRRTVGRPVRCLSKLLPLSSRWWANSLMASPSVQ